MQLGYEPVCSPYSQYPTSAACKVSRTKAFIIISNAETIKEHTDHFNNCNIEQFMKKLSGKKHPTVTQDIPQLMKKNPAQDQAIFMGNSSYAICLHSIAL
jgi:hypothetical protein